MDFTCVLPLVFPVVELDRLSPGVTDVTVFWIIKGNLTQLNLLCQVATDPGSSAEVTSVLFKYISHAAELKVGHFIYLFVCLFTFHLCVCNS